MYETLTRNSVTTCRTGTPSTAARNPQAQVVRMRHPHCGPLGRNQTETPGITNFAQRESLVDSAQSKTALSQGQNRVGRKKSLCCGASGI
jgi:hypothetical protein